MRTGLGFELRKANCTQNGHSSDFGKVTGPPITEQSKHESVEALQQGIVR